MNNFFGRYGHIFILIIIILASVLFRSFSWSGFRYDASSMAQASSGGNNIIRTGDLPEGNVLLIDLGPVFRSSDQQPAGYLRMSPDSVLSKENFRKIRKHEGPVVLISSEPAIAARLWMIISQKGIKNIKILRDETVMQK